MKYTCIFSISIGIGLGIVCCENWSVDRYGDLRHLDLLIVAVSFDIWPAAGPGENLFCGWLYFN
jgi:hypothetical protein